MSLPEHTGLEYDPYVLRISPPWLSVKHFFLPPLCGSWYLFSTLHSMAAILSRTHGVLPTCAAQASAKVPQQTSHRFLLLPPVYRIQSFPVAGPTGPICFRSPQIQSLSSHLSNTTMPLRRLHLCVRIWKLWEIQGEHKAHPLGLQSCLLSMPRIHGFVYFVQCYSL